MVSDSFILRRRTADSRPWRERLSVAGLLVIGSLAAGSCGGPKPAAVKSAPPVVLPGADGAAEPNDPYAAAAVSVQQMFNAARERQAREAARSIEIAALPPPVASRPEPGPGELVGPPAPSEAEANTAAAVAASAASDQHKSEAPAPVDPARRKNELIDELTRLLEASPDVEGDGGDAFRRGIQMVVLEALQPGAASGSLKRLEGELSPSERRVIEALRDAMGQVASGSAAAASPSAVATLLQDTASRLSGGKPVAIPMVALCQRVESYGRYTPFPQNRFAAGTAQDLIVYVEVEHFAERPWTAADGGADAMAGAEGAGDSSTQWVTELGQEITLYSEAGYQAMYRPEQVVRDVTRRPRRDYYMVQRITLPPTLSIGRYTLKVRVRDKTSRAEAERNIPIEIVDRASAPKSR